MVHHVLVVSHEGHFSFKFRIEVVLSFCEHVTLLCHCGGVAFLTVTEAISLLIILTETVVESLFAMTMVLHYSKTS